MRPDARLCIALALALLLAGCGFQFRDSGQWPAAYGAVLVNEVPPARDFALALRRALQEKGATLTEKSAEARLIIDVKDVTRERKVTALNTAGKATEYEVIYQVRFSARHGDGKAVLPVQAVQDRRNYAYAPARALGHDQQEDRMIQAMVRQVAAEVVRRLAMLPQIEAQQK